MSKNYRMIPEVIHYFAHKLQDHARRTNEPKSGATPHQCRSAIFLLTSFQSHTPRVSRLCFEGRLGGTVSSAFCVSKTDSTERQRGAPQERPDACPEKYNLLADGAFLSSHIPLHCLPINSFRLNWRRAAQVIERLHTNLPCKEVNIIQILTADWR